MKKVIIESYLTRFIRYVIDWRRTRRIIRQVNELSDSTLDDIGLSRAELFKLTYTKDQKK